MGSPVVRIACSCDVNCVVDTVPILSTYISTYKDGKLVGGSHTSIDTDDGGQIGTLV